MPIFPATDSAIARFESANTAFHLIIGAWERFPIIALHQMRVEVGKLVEQLGEAHLLQLTQLLSTFCSCGAISHTPKRRTTSHISS